MLTLDDLFVQNVQGNYECLIDPNDLPVVLGMLKEANQLLLEGVAKVGCSGRVFGSLENVSPEDFETLKSNYKDAVEYSRDLAKRRADYNTRKKEKIAFLHEYGITESE